MQKDIDDDLAGELREMIRQNKKAILRLDLANRRLEWILNAPLEDLPECGYIDDLVTGKRIYFRKTEYRLP